MEYELLDTGIFDGDRYFDVFVEYAKESAGRRADPHYGCESWAAKGGSRRVADPVVPQHLVVGGQFCQTGPGAENRVGDTAVIVASHPDLGVRYLYCEGSAPLLFTENETNQERVFGKPNATPYVKDGINEYVVHGHTDKVNPKKTGTKACAHYQLEVPSGESRVIRLRLTPAAPGEKKDKGAFGDRLR